MKKLLIVLVSIGLAFGASAQKGFHGGGFRPRPHVIVGIGGGFGYYRPYSPFYSPYGYYPYGSPFYSSKPSRLQLDIEDIKLDYADRIKSVRMQDGMRGKEKRQRIKELKYERDRAILDAKKNYYYNRQGQS
jgi:hypothetical protein